MVTASEARELMDSKNDKYLKRIDKLIRKAAKQDYDAVSTPNYHWFNAKVTEEVTKRGFTVTPLERYGNREVYGVRISW
jgi:hypothetical protein